MRWAYFTPPLPATVHALTPPMLLALPRRSYCILTSLLNFSARDASALMRPISQVGRFRVNHRGKITDAICDFPEPGGMLMIRLVSRPLSARSTARPSATISASVWSRSM